MQCGGFANCIKRIADIVLAGFINQSIRSKECGEFHRFVGSASHQRASWPYWSRLQKTRKRKDIVATAQVAHQAPVDLQAVHRAVMVPVDHQAAGTAAMVQVDLRAHPAHMVPVDPQVHPVRTVPVDPPAAGIAVMVQAGLRVHPVHMAAVDLRVHPAHMAAADHQAVLWSTTASQFTIALQPLRARLLRHRQAT